MSEISGVTPNRAPYVVSADAVGLLGRWASRNNYDVPSHVFFDDLAVDLGVALEDTTGLSVDIVPEDEIREGMDRLVQTSEYPIISLDRAYFDNGHPAINGHIDITRAVREEASNNGRTSFISASALAPRPGFPSLDDQLESLRSQETSPITLLDDVIFTGDGAADLAKKLESVGRPVAKIIAGIGIQDGVNKLEDAGIEVVCARIYDEVTDEVCQRDFLAGVPMSGRTVLGDNGDHWSAPYFLPYGDPESWASIPADQCTKFSRFCLQQSLDVWREVEAASGREVPAAAVPRALKGTNGQGSITTLLQRHLTEIS